MCLGNNEVNYLWNVFLLVKILQFFFCNIYFITCCDGPDELYLYYIHEKLLHYTVITNSSGPCRPIFPWRKKKILFPPAHLRSTPFGGVAVADPLLAFWVLPWLCWNQLLLSVSEQKSCSIQEHGPISASNRRRWDDHSWGGGEEQGWEGRPGSFVHTPPAINDMKYQAVSDWLLPCFSNFISSWFSYLS